MKKKYFFSMSMLLLFFLTIDNVDAQVIEKIADNAYYPQMSQDGTSVIFTTANYKGLIKKDLSTTEEDLLTEDLGAGYDFVFNENQVALRVKRDSKSIIVIDVDTKQQSTLQLDEYQNRKLGKRIDNLPIDARTTANLKAIELIYSDGRVVLIDNVEVGENRVWVSLSPDRNKVLFTVVGQKTYITDLKGNVISYINEAQAPKWANNNTVVFMKTLDNGDKILKGDIFTYKLNSSKPIILTDAFNDVALFPSMCEDESKVVFSTEKGELYIINLQ